MKKKFLSSLFIFIFSTGTVLAQSEKPFMKLKRADCFFGIHFDLHASEDIDNAGKTLTAEMIDTFLIKVHPDFIQIDCKGHPGISSYPTKVGFHVKGFEKDLGIISLKTLNEAQTFIGISDKIGAIRSPLESVVLNPEVKTTSTFYEGSDFRLKGKMIASSLNTVGRGIISAVYFNEGSDYKEYKSPVLRDFINSRISELFPDLFVKVTGTHLVHVTLNRLNDRMYVNLINIAGEHTNQNAIGYDEIPSIKDITVSIKTGQKPAQIILQPGGKELDVDFQNGTSRVVVPELKIHSILEVIL